MSSQTANYGLIKPGMNDSAIITSMSTNMDSIDAILKRVEDDIDALEALKATLIGDAQTKADAVSALIDGQALEPASIEATGAITANSIADANGTLAALRESVSKMSGNQSISNTTINILSYNSSSNMYTAPSDGYVLAQVWSSDSTVDLWIERENLKIPISSSAIKAYALYLRKGMHVWIGGSGNSRSAVFSALSPEQ